MPICGDCGSGEELRHVSPDCSNHDSSWIEANTQVFEFTLDGELLFRLHLTADYARAHGLEPGTYPLVEDLPSWFVELHLICMSCLKRSEMFGG